MNGVSEDGGTVISAAVSQAPGAVLVIEDCEPLLFFLNSALLSLGYENQHLAANLAEAEAVWAIHKDQIQHVILNYELPDGLGPEFAVRILRERPEVNIVITTGYDIASIRDTCGDANPVQFLQKPFKLSELQAGLGVATA
ncbi:MAG TPA: response regulator [Verrucomicrobiae bacterium]